MNLTMLIPLVVGFGAYFLALRFAYQRKRLFETEIEKVYENLSSLSENEKMSKEVRGVVIFLGREIEQLDKAIGNLFRSSEYFLVASVFFLFRVLLGIISEIFIISTHILIVLIFVLSLLGIITFCGGFCLACKSGLFSFQKRLRKLGNYSESSK